MRPAQLNMYAQPSGVGYGFPPGAGMYPVGPGPLEIPSPHLRYGRSQNQAVSPVQHHVVYPYAPVGVPADVVGSPVYSHMQPMMTMQQSGHGGPQQQWPGNSLNVEFRSNHLWSYGPERSGGQQGGAFYLDQDPRGSSNWSRSAAPGVPANGAQMHYQAPGDGFNRTPFVGETNVSRVSERGSGTYGGRHSFTGTTARVAAPSQLPVKTNTNSMASQAKSFTCEACEKTFTIPSQMTAHMGTHVPCDEIGCSFSASGKVVKVHKQTVHGKSGKPPSVPSLKPASEESSQEIRSWCEERKRNYPTRSNIQRKAEELKRRLARGELVDEDARKRRQRMKDILAKQAELGVPVAEVPAYYISEPRDTMGRRHRAENREHLDDTRKQPSSSAAIQSPLFDGSTLNTSQVGAADTKKRKHSTIENTETTEDVREVIGLEDEQVKIARVTCNPENGHTSSLETPHSLVSAKPLSDRAQVSEGRTSSELVKRSVGDEVDTETRQSNQLCYFFQQGRCKRGSKCHYVHSRQGGRAGEPNTNKVSGRNQSRTSDAKRPPTLLSKLLGASILRDKSYILQCLRFFVNNDFLLEWPKISVDCGDWVVEKDTRTDCMEEEVQASTGILAADAAIIKLLDMNGDEDGEDEEENNGDCH